MENEEYLERELIKEMMPQKDQTWEERFDIDFPAFSASLEETLPKIKVFLASELEKKEKDNEILVETILATKNAEIKDIYASLIKSIEEMKLVEQDYGQWGTVYDKYNQAITDVLALIKEKQSDKEKIPCDCPRGGGYERENGEIEICEKCNGTEWVIKEKQKE